MSDERVERIKTMESKYDNVKPKVEAFKEKLDEMKKIYEDLKVLSDYYSSNWKSDYEADEEGKIPKDLKRGILGQDTLFDFFTDCSEIGNEMKNLADKINQLK